METMKCDNCGESHLVGEFLVRKSGKGKGYFVSPKFCRTCRSERMQEYRHLAGKSQPMAENRQCASFLGVHVAERVLAAYFKNVNQMPYGNPGFDFICGKGFRIDVKSACKRLMHGRRLENTYYSWGFTIRKNHIPDYFLCIAFDDRESLTPRHVWLIPKTVIGDKDMIYIADSPRRLKKWEGYEYPINEVIACCDKLKS